MQEMAKRLFFFCFLCLTSYSLFAVEGRPNLRRACTIFSVNDSDVVLHWNKPQDACGSFASYQLYAKKDIPDPFLLLDVVTDINQTTYTHVGALNESTNWQYFMIINFKCDLTPTVSSDTISIDAQNPLKTDIDSISVDPNTGHLIIGWSSNPSPDLMEYQLYRTANNIPLLSTTDTFYISTTSDGNIKRDTFSIASVDSCRNRPGISDYHVNMMLSQTIDTCANEVSLSWTPYIGWGNDIRTYRILVSTNSGPFILTDSSSSTSYIFDDFTPGDSLCFMVRAVRSNRYMTSSSNRVCVRSRRAKVPDYTYVSRVSVSGQQAVDITWTIDASGYYLFSTLQKSLNGTNYIDVDVFPNNGNAFQSYTDNNTNTAEQSYYYRVLTTDACSNIVDTSNWGQTILLQISQDDLSNGNLLQWNSYQTWDADVENYTIYRGFDNGSGPVWNTLTQIQDSSFIDTNVPQDEDGALVCYYVEANERSGNQFGLQETSASNVRCEVRDMIVHIPNAFSPNGFNPVFKPEGLFIDFDRSTMTIYNRWGEVVKEVTDISVGWDGTNQQGSVSPAGIYIYKASLWGNNGKQELRNGTVTLLN